MVGWVGQLAEVTLADLASLFLVGVQDRRPVLDRRFGGNVLHGARLGGERDVRIDSDVLHPLGLTTSGHQIFHVVDFDGGDGDFLRLHAGALDDDQVSLCTTPVAIANLFPITRLNDG
jgi:hypothetical protein